jgi:uroporphyrinogen decarboxylase
MTSRERLKTALNHCEPDRVPYDLAGTTVTSISGLAYERAMKFKGYSDYYDESETVDLVSQIIIPPEEMLVKLKSDTRRAGANRILELEKMLGKEGDTWILKDQYNCTWEMAEGSDFYFNQTYHPLEQYDDISDVQKQLVIPDLSSYKNDMYELFDTQIAKSPESPFIFDRNCAGLTEMYLRFRGYEKGYMDMAMYPDETREILDRIAEHKIQYWDIVGDYILDKSLEDTFQIVSECDDLGTQQSLLVSPQMLNDLVYPSMRLYMGFIKKKMPGVKIFFHSCGAVKSIIPEFIDMGIDILNPVQYTASTMDLSELKRDFGKDIVFWGGGIDTQSTLSRGSTQEIRDEVKRNIDILAPGGGYIFAPVHNIQEDVSPENFWAMWEAWEEFS